ncbi:hypothetical protein [Allopontixanthobacter sediminis]|uniref:Uncharacterized protein n=1 Tax=Allopontixanthobacter sediminis TaxID=1689985 RepID=A0A845B325_9SPHN|nr:hypothetical protein [Allopontixanthobacter sediminis]MXP44586.1 hypothetical protein [Allopontixanthobacter sediminis]
MLVDGKRALVYVKSMPTKPSVRRLRNGAALITLLAAVFAFIFVDAGAAVKPSARPSAQDVGSAKEVWSELRSAQKTGSAAQVEFSAETIAGLAGLLSDVTGIQRVEARLENGTLSIGASIPLPLGLWVNTESTVAGHHTGFPAYHLKVGHISFPPPASRWLVDLARWGLGSGGAQIPPLDELVRRVIIEDQRVIAEIALPRNTNVVDKVMAAGSVGIDQSLVKNLYCLAAADQLRNPSDRLPVLVNRIFANAPSAEEANYNRAAFAALALLVVGEQAEALVPEAASQTKNCRSPRQPIYLHDREDLAKHWVFSAALTSVLGARIAANLGEWKELSDSLPDGSGFSFVDLAADRAGMQAALIAQDPKTAVLASRALKSARQDDLLPHSLLYAPEGLSEASFADRFDGLEAKRYDEAVARIDQRLALNPITATPTKTAGRR